MSVIAQDLRLYGSASMPDDDTPTDIGGAIDTSIALQWVNASGLFQGVSSSGADTTQSITVSYLDGAGAVQTIVIALNGTTPVTNATSLNELLKAIKSGTTTGDVAIEAQTATRSNTAQAGAATSITLDAGASAVNNFFRSQIVRITSGTGVGQIRQIISYNGTSKVADVDRAWGTNPDNTSVFRIAVGFFFEKAPTEILEARRPFYNAAAGVLAVAYYEKCFVANTAGADTLLSASVSEALDPTGLVTFALETSLNGTGTNGGGNNRQVAPSSGVGTFDSSSKSVTGGSLAPGDTQGVWLKLALGIGEITQNSSYVPRLAGSTA